MKSILESSTLPIGGAAKRLKEAEQAEMAAEALRSESNSLTSHLTDGIHTYPSHQNTWPTIAFQQAQPLAMHYPYGGTQQRLFCKQEIPDADTSSYQDLHQLQLGNNYNTHNFFQLHNLMNLDSSSMEHSSGSNSVMYSNGSNYGIPMGTPLGDQGTQIQEFGEHNDENPYGTTDPYAARNMYYLSQQSSNGSACNNWSIPTAVPNLAPRTNSMALCHGAPTFTMWNDT